MFLPRVIPIYLTLYNGGFEFDKINSNVNVTREMHDNGSKQPRASEVEAAVDTSLFPLSSAPESPLTTCSVIVSDFA